MKKLILLFVLINSLFIVSCGGDDNVDCTQNEFVDTVNSAIDALNQAGATWASDPTEANCNKLKDAANDYLDTVEGFKNCDAVSQTDYDQQIQAARDAVDSIPC